MSNKSGFVERLAMKKKNPQKNLIISWIVIGAGIFFATIGAVTAQDYKLFMALDRIFDYYSWHCISFGDGKMSLLWAFTCWISTVP